MSIALKRQSRPRRGVTLVEMLVVVALVVLMMVILVQIFQSALGAMSASRTTQELDVVLRSIDSMIRSDLNGVTARMTPPNDPVLKLGYFEYGENAASDLQGEDTDDFLAFTTRAPEGQVFTGRQWLSGTASMPSNQAIQPATVSSQVAEVIYFLRNGNLYRRVFLVAPERKSSIAATYNAITQANLAAPLLNFPTSLFGNPQINVSWQGMNEISCRPGGFSRNPINGMNYPNPPIPNDLGDLTNRERRAFRPRFMNDFTDMQFPTNPNAVVNGSPDGIPDDSNGDDIPDYYPTLYFDGTGYSPTNSPNNWAPNQFVNENVINLPYPPMTSQSAYWRKNQDPTKMNPWDTYAFPFIYPGMYSVPDPNRVGNSLGWVHYLPPNSATGYLNHAPLDLGETSGFNPGTLPTVDPANLQTWWGFPTWRESMAGMSNGANGVGWTDPITFVSAATGYQQPLGLSQYNPALTPLSPKSSWSRGFLPPVHSYGSTNPPYAFDVAGTTNFRAGPPGFLNNPASPDPLWEDDLILSNVRSFDVKAYDPYAPLYNKSVGTYLSAGYWDLGYAGLSPSTYAPNYGANSTIFGTNGQGTPFQAVNGEPQGFGHEGRIPPIPSDFRLDPRRPFIINAAGNLVPNNIGDSSTGVIRLTHTFDTWSTDYTNAPTSDILLYGISSTSKAIYPAFPAPYPSPLRGIQIQIRVTDPRNERTKVLTIRQDFTDKL